MKRIIGLLISLISVLAVLVSCTPILSKSYYFVILGIIIIALFMGCWLNKPKIRNNFVFVFFFFLYILLTASYRMYGISDDHWGNSMHEYFFFISFIVTLLLIYSSSKKQIQRAYWIMSVIMAFNIADNIVLSVLFPQLREFRAAIDEETLSSLNAGDSTFYTFSLFYCNVSFFVFLNATKKNVKWVAAVMAVLAAVFIIGFCNKGSVVLFLCLSVFLQYFVLKSKNLSGLLIVVGVFCLFLFAFVKIYNEELVRFVNNNFSERLATRFITIIDHDSSYADEVTVTGRTDLYALSLKTWTDSPINFLIGIGDKRDMQEAFSIGIGQHSDLLDSLARYGILGGLILLVMLVKIFKRILSLFDNIYRRQLMVIIFIFILNGCSKVVFVPEVGAALFIMLPLSANLVNHSKY